MRKRIVRFGLWLAGLAMVGGYRSVKEAEKEIDDPREPMILDLLLSHMQHPNRHVYSTTDDEYLKASVKSKARVQRTLWCTTTA